MDLAAIAEQCAPSVASRTLESIASVESASNPFAIGIVGAKLERQPRTLAEATVTARMLEREGYNYSLGLLQVNRANFQRFGLTIDTAFDPCHNLNAGSRIFADCYKRAGGLTHVLGDALSCFYSNNFKTGYRDGYVAQYQKTGALEPSIGVSPIPVVTATRGRTRKAAGRAGDAAMPAGPSFVPLFVSAAPALVPGAALSSDYTPSTPKSSNTALLF